MKPLICIVGASGSGKTTLCNELEQVYGLKQIPSYTTRKPRYEGEKGHTFIADEEFDKLKNIVAQATTTGARYCVTTEMFENEDYSLYVIDNTGLKYLADNYKGVRPIKVVYIDCPLRQRYERIKERAIDQDDSIGYTLERIVHDAVEFRDVPYDIKIENADGRYKQAFASLFMFCVGHGLVDGKVE